MPDRVLTLRELNRATLARQLLLKREAVPVEEAVSRVAGLQAQVANPPYIGLWNRVAPFDKADLTRAMEEKRVVRATAMRSTIHLLTGDDYRLLQPALQPALARALYAFFGPKARDLDVFRVTEAARRLFADGPQPFTALRARLQELEPERDAEAMAYAARTHLPLVQVPPAGTWGYGGPVAYASAETYLGQPLGAEDLSLLLRRYLSAFGPATVKDFQAWSGLTGQKAVVEGLRDGLRTYRTERGAELLDVPDAPLPPEDAPAPPRFLPEYDNLILSHDDRTRVVPLAYRRFIYLSAARVRATFLLDGVVAGTWKVEKERDGSALFVEPFAPLADAERDALAEEGGRLLDFIADGDEGSRAVRFAEASPAE